MVMGSRSRTRVSGIGHLEISSSLISFQPNVKDLGDVLDSGLTIYVIICISSICCSAYLELRRIGSIHPFLTVEAAAELACSRILSRIDYCNSLLAGITSEQIARLQKIQNRAARLIFRKKRHDHVTPLLKKFYWVPVSERIVFQLATLSFLFLMAHYHLTSPAVCPHTHPPDLSVLPLKNFSPSQESI